MMSLTMLYLRSQSAIAGAARRIRNALRERDGATIAEYALLLALVVVGLIAVLETLGSTLEQKINEIVTKISTSGN